MSEPIDIDNNYESRERDASPRRDRDRSPRRDNEHYRERPSEFREKGPPKYDRNYYNSVFVGNLSFDTNSNQLRDLFKDCGKIIRADIVTQHGRHRGMATVEFASRSEAENAVSRFHQTDFMNRQIFVRPDNPPPAGRDDRRREGREDRFAARNDRFGGRGGFREERFAGRRDDRFGARDNIRSAPPRGGPQFEVFIGNLPFRFRWQDLKDMLRPFGNVLRADVKTDYDGRSRGFGTASFETIEEVRAAIDGLNGTEVEGRRIEVREGRNSRPDNDAPAETSGQTEPYFQRPPPKENSEFTKSHGPDGEKNDTIFVGNLPYATSTDDLYELFESVGRVDNAELKYDSYGKPGAAVVKFESEESSEAAVQKLNQYEYGERRLNISYAQKL